MSPTRREVIAQLAALSVASLHDWNVLAADPLGGTIAEFQAGRRKKLWTSVEVTTKALARCRTIGAQLHAIDALSATALADARASDARLRAGRLRGLLDGVPVFAKSIYDMN